MSKPSSHSRPTNIKFKESLWNINVLSKDNLGVETFPVWLTIIWEILAMWIIGVCEVYDFDLNKLELEVMWLQHV